eukprot:m.258229 g.258229  ORF g.258229 m.258229 type:complete len:96 (+) comp15536_c3_seq7:5989-6276(+)
MPNSKFHRSTVNISTVPAFVLVSHSHFNLMFTHPKTKPLKTVLLNAPPRRKITRSTNTHLHPQQSICKSSKKQLTHNDMTNRFFCCAPDLCLGLD